MSTSFYNAPDRIIALRTAALGWLGTPFMGNAAVKGAGVSCQTLVAHIYIESGFLPADFEIVKAPMDWSHAQTESVVVKAVNEHPDKFAPVPPFPLNALRPGDLLGFRIGGCVHHCGVVTAEHGQFIHCLRGPGTVFSELLDASYASRLDNVWRPISPPQAPSPAPRA